MIIVEGPDGGGKTTLVNKIHKAFELPLAPKASDSLKGPVPNLCRWVDNDLLEWGSKPLAIYDRYPLISEPIYGSAIRGKLPLPMTRSWMRSRTNTMRSLSLVIWCVPPFDVVKANVIDHPGEHMTGVAEDIDAIWSLYAWQSNVWPALSMAYDYDSSSPEAQETHLYNLVRRHVLSWRNF